MKENVTDQEEGFAAPPHKLNETKRHASNQVETWQDKIWATPINMQNQHHQNIFSKKKTRLTGQLGRCALQARSSSWWRGEESKTLTTWCRLLFPERKDVQSRRVCLITPSHLKSCLLLNPTDFEKRQHGLHFFTPTPPSPLQFFSSLIRTFQ